MMPRCRGEVILRADEVLRHGGEVLEVVDVLLLDRGLVPGGTELAAAADVGERVDAAAREPRRADRRRCSVGTSETSKPP